MDLNEKATKMLGEFYQVYFIENDKKKAATLSEEIEREFGPAVGTLLTKKVSEAVIEVGNYWIENKISKKTKKS